MHIYPGTDWLMIYIFMHDLGLQARKLRREGNVPALLNGRLSDDHVQYCATGPNYIILDGCHNNIIVK